ncbi:hypothetical protein ACFSTI_08120 [Rhizorhabdus histidinilytica]
MIEIDARAVDHAHLARIGEAAGGDEVVAIVGIWNTTTALRSVARR